MVGRGALHEHEHVITSHNFYILTVLSRRICWRVPVTIQLQLQPAASLATRHGPVLIHEGIRRSGARARLGPGSTRLDKAAPGKFFYGVLYGFTIP